MSLETVPCPLCGQSGSLLGITVPSPDPHLADHGDLYAGKSLSEWKVCGACGFVHQNPRPTTAALNAFYMAAAYHSKPSAVGREEHLRFARWYFNEKIDYSLRHSGLKSGRVFDIGCGRGGVLKLYEERGWQTFGVEPDKNLASFAINELGVQGVRQGILDSRFELPQKVDLVFSNHAFEHFADLHDVVKGVRNILKEGGYMFIAIPTYYRNRSSLSKEWMNSAHYSLFTHHSLNNLLSRHGFEEVTHTYNGWYKEVDDLWYVARYTGKPTDPKVHYESPRQVQRYLQTVNPLRSLVLYPIYSHWAARVRLFNGAKLLLTSPGDFFKKLSGYRQRRAEAK
jgi:SAM-dependent methyltransferase